MEILRFNMLGLETKRFEKAGRYFEIIESAAPLDIEFTGPNGEQGEDMRGALSGFYSEGSFSGLEVRNASASAQSVVLMVTGGRGGSRRQPGVVSVTNLINAGLATADVAVSSAIGFALDSTIVTPAANLAGMRIRWAAVFGRAGAGGVARVGIVAAPTAPAGQYPANGLPVTHIATANTAQIEERRTEHINVQVPAGWGLYVVRSHEVAASTYAQAVASYELL